jgi:beta-ureidopropionase
MNRVRAVCIQIGPGGAGADDVRKALRSAGHVDLVVLPEISHLPYFPVEWPSIYTDKSVTLNDALVLEFRAIAAEFKTHIVFPLYLTEGQNRYNSAILIGPDGALMEGEGLNRKRRVSYHKCHLINIQTPRGRFYESRHFSPGEGLVLWETTIGKIGILICYDRHFPEAWRSLRILGAEVICVPVASPLLSEDWFVAEIQTMAMQEGVYALAANRAGIETLESSGLTTEYVGLSCIVSPDGKILATAGKSEPGAIVAAELDSDLLTRVRSEYTYLEDRRPETYISELK